MKALILAAGFGSRLMPLTEKVPKTMVEYQGKKIIEYEIEALNNAGIPSNDIAVVGGYQFEVLKDFLTKRFHLNTFFENKNYASTNMLHSLFCARDFLKKCQNKKEDIIISYADIVYFEDTVQKLIQNQAELAICVDKQWQKLWEKRFEDILSDAETLKIKNGFIVEIGKKPKSLNEIQAQYMGLFKIKHSFLNCVFDLYDNLDKNALFEGQPYSNIYMTSFLQHLIHQYHNAQAVEINGNWCEIDFKTDLEIDFKKI